MGIGLIVAAVGLAAACGSAPSPSNAAGPAAAQPATGPASSAPAGAAAAPSSAQSSAPAWTQLVDAAKREGRVVVAGPPFPGLRQGVAEGFEKTYGISVEYLGLPSGEANVRIEREAQLGKPTIDVDIGGSPVCWSLAERGYLDNLADMVMDPANLDAAVWRDGAPRRVKPSPELPRDFTCGIQATDWIMTDLFVNRDMIPPTAIRSWKDLLKPEYRGRIVSHDPRRPGSGGATVGYLGYLFGDQFLQDLYAGQQVALTADYRQLAEWVGRGNYPIGLSLVQASIEPLRAAGLPIERVFPDDGPGSTLGGFSVIMKIKGSTNPNAAVLFINWYLSKEGQSIWEREMLETSLRTDLPHNVPDYIIPRPGVQYVDGYDPEFYFGHRLAAEAKVAEILGR
jgi:ABC-type Fe3+ transport system substrate-binding protein